MTKTMATPAAPTLNTVLGTGQAVNAQEDMTLGQLAPDSVGYVAAAPDQRNLCANCCFFIAGENAMCQKVKGEVAPGGWCKLYKNWDREYQVDAEGNPVPDPQHPTTVTVPVPVTVAVVTPEATTPDPTAHAAALLESIDLSEAKVDNAERVIRNVRLIASGVSKNRRNYSEAVLQNALKAFEGLKAYADHPRKPGEPRSVREVTGWYANVEYQRGAITADRYFTRNSAGEDAWMIAKDIAEGRAPATLAGLSINAVGTGKSRKTDDGDILDVESITFVNSVDDVDNPAAGGTYALVAGDMDPMIRAVFDTVSYEEWVNARVDYAKRARKEWQTVKLEETTQRALAEADDKVKAAEAKAGQLATELTEAAERTRTAERERDTVAATLLTTQVDLAIERSRLPAVYAEDLRKRLPETPPDQWAALIEVEKKKAARAGHNNRPDVTGAGAQQMPSVAVTPPNRNAGIDLDEALSDPAVFKQKFTERH